MSENNQLLMEVKCIYFTKIRVFPERIEIKPFFGEQSIPRSKVNGVRRNLAGQIIINTVGGEDYTVGAWNAKKGIKLYEFLKNWQV